MALNSLIEEWRKKVRGAVIRAGVLKEAEKADFRRSGLLDEGSGRR